MQKILVPESYLTKFCQSKLGIEKREHCFIVVRTEDTFLSAFGVTELRTLKLCSAQVT